MAPHYTPITLQEMHEWLAPQGFQSVQIPYVKEVVYSKLVMKDVCVRVFTTVELQSGARYDVGFTPRYVSRPVGGDAIRVCLVMRYKDGYIKGLGTTRRVHRTQGWKANLQCRIDEMIDRVHKDITVLQGKWSA